MKLFDLFRRKAKKPTQERADGGEDLEIYTGMRVEVTSSMGRMLFVAKLLGLRGNEAELHQYSETDLPEDSEPVRVNIRGYSDRERKAVCMEGTITPTQKKVWHVEELTLTRAGNDRAFFRLETKLDATATMFNGPRAGEKPCKLLNISVGGAGIGSEEPYDVGDKFLLKVRLLEDRPESTLYCQVLRIIEKDGPVFEYGCQFLKLTEADEEKIAQDIFAAQRKQMGRF